MSSRVVATSTFWQLLSQAAMAVLSILAAKFVAIGLSKELVGHYYSAYGYLQIFAVVADFGLYAVAVREMSKTTGEDREKTLGALLVLRGVILAVSMGAALAIVWLVPMWRGTPFPIGVTIAALVPVFTLLAGMVRTVFQVHFQLQFVFIAEVMQRILTTVGIGLFILAGVRLSANVIVYEWFIGIGGIGAVLLFVISSVYAARFMRVWPCFDWILIKRLAVLAAPYGLAYLLMAMYRQLDVVFIALLRPDFAIQNAYYGFAGRVEEMAFLIPTFLLNSILPILTVRLATKQDASSLLGKTLLILLLAGSVLLLFSLLWARPLTLMFATPLYLGTPGNPGSDTAFALMSVPMFLNGLILFSFYVFLAAHAWRRLIASFGIGVLLTVILNLLWTGRFGFVGAAWALIVTHALLTAILLPQTLRVSPIRLTAKAIGQWIAFSLLLAAILYLSAPYITSSLGTVIGGALMIGVLALLTVGLGIHRTLKWSAAEDQR